MEPFPAAQAGRRIGRAGNLPAWFAHGVATGRGSRHPPWLEPRRHQVRDGRHDPDPGDISHRARPVPALSARPGGERGESQSAIGNGVCPSRPHRQRLVILPDRIRIFSKHHQRISSIVRRHRGLRQSEALFCLDKATCLHQGDTTPDRIGEDVGSAVEPAMSKQECASLVRRCPERAPTIVPTESRKGHGDREALIGKAGRGNHFVRQHEYRAPLAHFPTAFVVRRR